MKKWIYEFSQNNNEVDISGIDLLGGKGYNLAQMCKLGLPVPPGFTITTEVCTYYYKNNNSLPSGVDEQVRSALLSLSIDRKSSFGDEFNPLLLSVRSGSRASMPGMMDSILNIGLNDLTVEGLAKKTQNERFAYDSYRRLIQMYSEVVIGIEHHYFEELLDLKKADKQVKLDTELDVNSLKELVDEYKKLVRYKSGKDFPQDVMIQLNEAIDAVFKSWMNSRAVTYRAINNIPEEWGTAVNVQSMVFGNMGNTSASGVAFTRNPSTGENYFYGEYLVNSQGEDVVAGTRNPQPITIFEKEKLGINLPSMQELMPQVYFELLSISKKLELYYKDMQDIEFTVENEKLWILQTRSGKRSVNAAIKIAVDLVSQGIISKKEAILRIEPNSIDQLLHPSLDVSRELEVVVSGLPASPGAASGKVCFNAFDAINLSKNGDKVILVRNETSPEDIEGMHAAVGILTSRGGMTSHAAVVARGMGKPCVCGAISIFIDSHKKIMIIKDKLIVKEGDIITIDGSVGSVMLGEIPTVEPVFSEEFKLLMSWADEFRKLKVRVNAETINDAKTAVEFSAEGIGLCRTEHMFFAEDRINKVREMILASDEVERKNALEKLLPLQKKDFMDLMNIMNELPINIRLLDPPLHEFLPNTEEEIKLVSKESGLDVEYIKYRCYKLKENNPMLGHRGCRLGITYPEIYKMQARAIFEALAEVKKNGLKANVEVMIPLVMSLKEFTILKEIIDETAQEIMKENSVDFSYEVGTMIELPRAALKAEEISSHAEYFSFGTNDLTQTVLGISRDDSNSFISNYKDKGIVDQDPFIGIDESVGEMISIAVERGRKVKKDLKLGICGEHGADPKSIEFFDLLGFSYISCSPYRIPIARLAAAHAAIKNNNFT